MTFTIDRTVTPPVIRCNGCRTTERYWDDRQASRYKTRHACAPKGSSLTPPRQGSN